MDNQYRLVLKRVLQLTKWVLLGCCQILIAETIDPKFSESIFDPSKSRPQRMIEKAEKSVSIENEVFLSEPNTDMACKILPSLPRSR